MAIREKRKLEVTFDLEEAFEFIRLMGKGKSLDAQRHLEEAFRRIRENANISFLTSLQVALANPMVDANDFYLGCISGLALALAVSRPDEEGSVRGFLEAFYKKPEHIRDISEALRKH